MKCRCACGKTRIVIKQKLWNGTKSCGCLSADNTRRRSITHGLSSTKTYKAWVQMRQRCENPNNPAYRYYGERGIRVCRRWQSFANFVKDMGVRPSPKLTIDRINNYDGYNLSNCRWATRKQQAKNQRRYQQPTLKGNSDEKR